LAKSKTDKRINAWERFIKKVALHQDKIEEFKSLTPSLEELDQGATTEELSFKLVVKKIHPTLLEKLTDIKRNYPKKSISTMNLKQLYQYSGQTDSNANRIPRFTIQDMIELSIVHAEQLHICYAAFINEKKKIIATIQQPTAIPETISSTSLTKRSSSSSLVENSPKPTRRSSKTSQKKSSKPDLNLIPETKEIVIDLSGHIPVRHWSLTLKSLWKT
jgi:hypothetical protein